MWSFCCWRVTFLEIQVWASQGGGTHKPPTDLVFRQKASWGVGRETRTLLKDADGQVGDCVCKFPDDDEEEEAFNLKLLSSQSGANLNYSDFAFFHSMHKRV